MLSVYPAIFHEEEGYWVEFPDLEGCLTQGESIEEATENAQEALGLYLVSLMERKISVPKPTRLEEHKPSDGFVTYVSVDPNIYRRDTKAVKKMLSIPAWLAKEAEASNISLSKVLQEALMVKLNM